LHNILVIGAGNIGTLIACMLSDSKKYQVFLTDMAIDRFDSQNLGTQSQSITLLPWESDNKKQLNLYIQQHHIHAIVSCLPYYANYAIAVIAKEQKIHYFDLTEDISHTEKVIELAANATTAFVPQCGLAPGFISIVAHEYMQHFDTIDAVLMRVGALPVYPNNALKFALTWSTDGLINEYGNPCFGIQNGKIVTMQPLEGRQTIQIDGLLYEAFNTSGGLGTLAKSYENRVKTMNYKTLRYPGHADKMQFLMNDLKLNDHRDVLKKILEEAIPKTTQDVVLIYVAVSGKKNHEYREETYVKKIYPIEFVGRKWSSIQTTTASGLCSVLDTVMSTAEKYQGLILQEQFSFLEIIQNRFGRCYAN
jgi:saccharopine dehydrogenase-like NADP-dependent oxidoreductase